jgi:short-chain fatty acids transporter
LSGSAPLLVATPGHFLEKEWGLIKFSSTIFSGWNLLMSAAMLVSLSALAWFLYPSDPKEIQPPPSETLKTFEREERLTPARLGRPWAVNAALGFGGLGYLGVLAARGQWNFDLNIFNFIFFMLAVLAHPDPASYLKAAESGAKTIAGIVLQFPLYAGIFGIIKTTGLSDMLARAFASSGSAGFFPLIIYFYSGILNYFVPSGGSKWAIEAPYLLDAARTLGVAPQKVVLAYAWGDMVTDLIQPFFCLPLLSAAGLEFRQIMGYLLIAFAASVAVASAGVLALGFM